MAEQFSGRRGVFTNEWFPTILGFKVDADGNVTKEQEIKPYKLQEAVVFILKALYWLRRRLAAVEEVTVVSGVAPGWQEIIFNLAAGTANLSIGTDVVPPRVTVNGTSVGTMVKWVARAGIAPTGAAIIITILKNSLAHVTITIPDGFAGTVTSTAITNATINDGDVFTVNVTQVGSAIPGRKVFLCGRYNFSQTAAA